MGIAEKYNNGGISWGVDTKDWCYKHLSNAGEGAKLEVKGFYINRRGQYDPAPVLISSDCFYNLPSYMTETVERMLKDDDLVAAVKAGKVYAEVRSFEDPKYHKTSWMVEWRDIDD